MQNTIALVSWPSAPLTDRLVRTALATLDASISISASPVAPDAHTLLVQWSSYDHIDHELTHHYRHNVLASSFTFRKALIRKHFLSRCLHSYITKHPASSLKTAVPKTYEAELSFADELDELWADDLWELAQDLDSFHSWWILKPGMSDRGMGIRLFNSKESLYRIFEEFDLSDSENEQEENSNATTVVTSQLRHFVIQEYVPNPLLLDPYEVPIDGLPRAVAGLQGCKFHLRAYCLASGALQVYLYDRVLALFSAVPYVQPMDTVESPSVDLTPHLTNTSLQAHKGEDGVRLLSELVGCEILSSQKQSERLVLTFEDYADLLHQMVEILSETFRAALANPVHFQPLCNAFELYGIDFLVAHVSTPSGSTFHVKLLEINAEPAIELTGPRLTWILEDLFVSIGKVCVEPFLISKLDKDRWEVGETRNHLVKVLAEEIRGSGMA